uniref:BED-type domain-containing protein n=1 Tax=Acrobeloides nanus TaxID=290746 RepID=A0A914DNN5_9BILA
MSKNSSLVWNHFTKLPSGTRKCKLCGKEFTTDGHNTSQLVKHLERAKDEAHIAEFKKFEEGKRKRKHENEMSLEEDQERAQEFFVVAPKRPKLDVDSNANLIQPTLKQLNTDWNPDGPKAKQLDRLIMEMIATDIRPLSIVENEGFQRVLNFIAPKYKLKSRSYFTTSLLPQLYNRMKNKVKDMLKNVNFLSFTCDAWTSKCNEHSLLSLTAHFLDSNFKPSFLVLAAKPIEGRHTAANLSDLIDKVLREYEIDHKKIHLILRDAASTMRACTHILLVDSEDCFAHLLQLVHLFIF